MVLKRRLPADRTYEQLKNHYLVEKEIADRIKKASPAERREIYATMYDELFAKVPDHPRLTIRDTPELTLKSNRSKFSQLKNLIKRETVFAEFAPGDCKFSIFMCDHVKQVYAIDISDQSSQEDVKPDNFKLIIYNGYDLDEMNDNTIDVLYSDQLIEHFHQDETKPHFAIGCRILKEGGIYIFRTPHTRSGPVDISMYFSEEAEGFHLKEWTYSELYVLLKDVGFRKIRSYWFAKRIKIRLPNIYFKFIEKILQPFPKKYIRKISRLCIPDIICEAVK